jgi:predicted DCC family thiol-disulfide oxidoreductase YuxK
VGVVSAEHPIIFYDGLCGLCNRFVQFVVEHDCRDRLRFAALQSDLAHELLEPHRVDLTSLTTVCMIANPGSPEEKLVTQSEAVIIVLAKLGGIWRITSFLLRIIPRPLRDSGYRVIARHRYQIFGRYDSCPIPNPKDAHRFVG